MFAISARLLLIIYIVHYKRSQPLPRQCQTLQIDKKFNCSVISCISVHRVGQYLTMKYCASRWHCYSVVNITPTNFFNCTFPWNITLLLLVTLEILTGVIWNPSKIHDITLVILKASPHSKYNLRINWISGEFDTKIDSKLTLKQQGPPQSIRTPLNSDLDCIYNLIYVLHKLRLERRRRYQNTRSR